MKTVNKKEYPVKERDVYGMKNRKCLPYLSEYNHFFYNIKVGPQATLIRDGREVYTAVDIEDFRKIQAELKLFDELQKGYQSLQNEKIVSREEFKNILEGS